MELTQHFEPERFGYDDASRVRDFIGEQLRVHGMDINRVKGMAIFGSGLGEFPTDYMDAAHANEASGPFRISFEDVYQHLREKSPNLGAISALRGSVKGHARSLIIGQLKDDTSGDLYLGQEGREHPYEGISTKRSTFWMRVAQLMGVDVLIGSNGAGILTPDSLREDDLMLVHGDRDFGDDSPLNGENDDRLGPRFPHKGDAYPEAERKIVLDVAKKMGINLKQGTYVRMPGPTYESTDDVYWLRGVLEQIWWQGRLANDPKFQGPYTTGVVGMSSTFENVVAMQAAQSAKYPAFRHRAYISAATNFAALLDRGGVMKGKVLTHEHVGESGRRVADKFGSLAQGTFMELSRRAA